MEARSTKVARISPRFQYTVLGVSKQRRISVDDRKCSANGGFKALPEVQHGLDVVETDGREEREQVLLFRERPKPRKDWKCRRNGRDEQTQKRSRSFSER